MSRLIAIAGGLSLAVLLVAPSSSHAGDSCRTVKGHITSEVVAVFSDGTPCSSDVDLCSEGRFSGGLKGRFRFTANTISPAVWVDPGMPGDVATTTGVIELATRRCRGLLVLDDVSAFSLGDDGLFGGVQTVDADESTRACARLTGRLRTFGVFQGGCVNCDYEGEICGLRGARDDDDDEDDDEEDDD